MPLYLLSMELRIVFICIIISLLRKCDGADLSTGQPHGSKASSLMPNVCRKDSNGTILSVEIRVPFMDMELHHEHSFYVLREEQLLLVLHGNELFQLQLGSQDKRLVRLGELSGRVSQQKFALAAAVVSWREYYILAVALEESLEVYQLELEAMMDPTQFHWAPIQDFALPGKLEQLELLKPNQNQVILLLNLNYTQTQGKIKTFEWLETYFNPIEELNLPAIKAFQVVGHEPHYLVTGRSLRGQSKLVLSIYELETPTLRLRRRQSLTVQARHLRAMRFRGRNWLVACGNTCFLFRMVDGNFVVYRKHVLRQLQFSHLATTELGQILVGTRANGEVLVFNTHRLDCYSGFIGTTNPSGLYTHRNPQNETFILLIHRQQPSTTLLRMVQLGGVNEAATVGLSMESNDDLSNVQQHRHEFEQTISALRSVLLRRKQQLDAVHHLSEELEQRKLHVDQPLHVGRGARIELVELHGINLRTPTQLRQRVEQLRQRYATAKRPVRAFGVGNESHTGTQEFLKVRRLHVENLIYHGELLPGYYLDTSEAGPLLTIKGQLLTQKLETQQKLIPQQSLKRPSRTLDSLQQAAHTVVQHLQVARINNVSWFDFYDSLFLHSRDNHIEGRLIVQSHARVVNLQTTLLNGLVVQQLFNLRQPQVVASNIFMSGFFAPKLDAKLVNGLDFAKDIVFRGTNETLIKTPVRINQMSVSGKIIIANYKKMERQMKSNDLSLQQYYTGKVIINGSLTVNNLQRDTEVTLLQMQGQSLRAEDLHADYLLLHQPQNLNALILGNAKLTAPALNTVHVNGHPTEQHLLLGVDQQHFKNHKKSLHIIFMNASVEGDIYCGNYSSRLAELSIDAVRHGEIANIEGYKRFEAPLTVETLSSQALNGIAVKDLVLKSQLIGNFSGLKQFGRIVVKDSVEINSNLFAQEINGQPLAQLLQPAYSVQRLELLETPQLQQLIFQRLNGLPFDELLSKLSVGPTQQLLLHKQLLIEGNVRFMQEVQLQTLNELPWNDYLSRLVNANSNTLISGRKSFLEPVLLTDAMQSPSINRIDLSALLDNTLLRATPQSIGGAYTIQRMSLGNLDVPSINGVSASSFVDTHQSSLQLQGDFYLEKLTINGSFSCGSMLHDPLVELNSKLAALQQRAWPKLVVLGDALWQEHSLNKQLDYLRQHAVRSGNVTQAIVGHVLLQNPRLNRLQTSQIFPGNLNFTHIAQDALLKRSTGLQSVEAPQELLQMVRASRINLLKDASFKQFNNIDLLRLNASLYRRSSGLPIEAKLSFVETPNLGVVQLPGQLNGADTRSIYQQSLDAQWPAVRLRHLQLHQQLYLGEINGMNLEYLLQERVPLRGRGGAALELFGTLNFENLVLDKEPMLRTINGIPLQKVVYKHGQRVQAIMGAKTFVGGIELHGPVHIMELNGKDLSESYQQSIFTDRDYSIDSLVLDAAIFQAGLVQEAPNVGAQQKPGQQMRQQLQQLQEQVTESRANHSQRLLYLDYEQQFLHPVWSPTEESHDLETIHTYAEPAGICQRQELRAQLSYSEHRVYLSNVSLANSFFRADALNATIRVKAQNYCSTQEYKSRVHINCRGQTHTLGLRQHVETLQILEQSEYSLLLIGTVSEVRVLHVQHANCNLSDWQSLQPASGRMMMRILHLSPSSVLLLSSGLHQHLPVVAVHRLTAQSQRLEVLQYIQGDYDLVELQDQQLLLSCQGCHRLDIHSFNTMLQQFVPLQQLRLEAQIQQLLPFSVGPERHLLVLTRSGSQNFYLLTYRHIEGWQQHTYGQMGQVLWSWPLIRSGLSLTATTPVLLLCGEVQCNLVTAMIG